MTDTVSAAAPSAPRVPKRVAAVIINSLKGGVVPRIGLPYITVGREAEIKALLTDLSLIADGGASFRFLVGRYGSGKSFLLQTIRTHAMGEGFVVADADLSPERRLQGGQGQGLATYRELMRNLSTKTRPEGGALTLILDRWLSNIETNVAASFDAAARDKPVGGDASAYDASRTSDVPAIAPAPAEASLRDAATPAAAPAPGDPAFDHAVEERIRMQVGALEELVHGFDFTRLLILYYRATATGDDDLKSNVVRWFRGEYRTKTEAKQDLGVSIIIGDDDWYDYIKLFAQFLKGAGYRGMLVLIDELVNLYKIPNSITRQYNYEKILTMYNDTLQGKAHYLGIIMGGTPQSIEDRRRGVFSYEALRSRLTQGRFAAEGMRDMLAPIIHLHPLTYEELLVLIEKLQQIHAGYFQYTPRLTENHLVEFLKVEFGRVGADTHLTPREVIRDFIELLDIAYQNPRSSIEDILTRTGSSGGAPTDLPDAPGGAPLPVTAPPAGSQTAPDVMPHPTAKNAVINNTAGNSTGSADMNQYRTAPAISSRDPADFAEFTI